MNVSYRIFRAFLHMRMGSVMHIQSFYDTEEILHREADDVQGFICKDEDAKITVCAENDVFLLSPYI